MSKQQEPWIDPQPWIVPVVSVSHGIATPSTVIDYGRWAREVNLRVAQARMAPKEIWIVDTPTTCCPPLAPGADSKAAVAAEEMWYVPLWLDAIQRTLEERVLLIQERFRMYELPAYTTEHWTKQLMAAVRRLIQSAGCAAIRDYSMAGLFTVAVLRHTNLSPLFYDDRMLFESGSMDQKEYDLTTGCKLKRPVVSYAAQIAAVFSGSHTATDGAGRETNTKKMTPVCPSLSQFKDYFKGYITRRAEQLLGVSVAPPSSIDVGPPSCSASSAVAVPTTTTTTTT